MRSSSSDWKLKSSSSVTPPAQLGGHEVVQQAQGQLTRLLAHPGLLVLEHDVVVALLARPGSCRR
jgi:hypothetical protein